MKKKEQPYVFDRSGGTNVGRERKELRTNRNRNSGEWLRGDGKAPEAREYLRDRQIRLPGCDLDGNFYSKTNGGVVMPMIGECIVYDTETTGLPNAEGSPLESQPKIIEFAGIKLDHELNEVGRLEFICNPNCQLSDKITEITGLRNSDVDDKEPFTAFYKQLCDFFLGVPNLIAHNATFDVSMMRFELQRMGKMCNFPWPHNHFCTIEKSYHLNGHRLNLTKLHKHCTGEDHINGAHRAMNDVTALVKCVKWMRQKELL